MNMDDLVNVLLYLLGGLKVTLYLSAASLLLGTLLGFVLGILAVVGNGPIKIAIAAYVLVVRGTPVLVQLFFIFFALPFYGIHIPAVAAAIIAFTIFAGALIAEIVRGAIQSVPKGQTEAAKAIGMRRWTVMRHIIFPQAFRSTLPSMASTFAMLIKGTSLASLVGIGELLKSGREIMSRTRASFGIMASVLVIYFIVIYPLARLSVWLEKRSAYVH